MLLFHILQWPCKGNYVQYLKAKVFRNQKGKWELLWKGMGNKALNKQQNKEKEG